MPRQKCDAYKVFEKNLERSRAFLRIFDIDRTAGQPSNDEKELLRGAIVFAIGALDSFLHELVLEVVPRFGGNRPALSDALRTIGERRPQLVAPPRLGARQRVEEGRVPGSARRLAGKEIVPRRQRELPMPSPT